MDEIEKTAIRARGREFIDRMIAQGIIVKATCPNGHTGHIPTEYGWFVFSTLEGWFEKATGTGARWPAEVLFQTECGDCAESGTSSPARPLPNG